MAQAYCGPAPEPHSLATAWNFDVVALSMSCALLCLFLSSGRRDGSLPFATALGISLILFVSPFCALTVALFSARVAHHVILIAIVAPLLALAFPRPNKLSLQFLVAIHALIVWLWHAPPVYDFAIASALPYWTMQVTLLGSAFLLWQRVLSPQTQLASALLALLATLVQMGMLGALLTFAREPLYQAHFSTTLPFGLTPHADQQLSGLIMWVPAALPYMVAAALLATRSLDRHRASATR